MNQINRNNESMNKYIKSDLRDSTSLMKAAIMNSLHDIDIGEETYINLGPNISNNILYKCLEEAKWEYVVDNKWKSYSGKLVLVNTPIVGEAFELKVTNEICREINISVSFSSSRTIPIPENIDITNQEAIKEFLKDKLYFPKNLLINDYWILDEYNVSIDN